MDIDIVLNLLLGVILFLYLFEAGSEFIFQMYIAVFIVRFGMLGIVLLAFPATVVLSLCWPLVYAARWMHHGEFWPTDRTRKPKGE